MSGLSEVDIKRMRDQLFFEGPERGRRLSRSWLLLPLAAVIASACSSLTRWWRPPTAR